MYTTIITTWLKFRLWKLKWQITRTWKQYGETDACQQKLAKQIEKLIPELLKTPLLPGVIPQLKDSGIQKSLQHHVICVPELATWRIALHILPAGKLLPAHIHPDTINIILTLAGDLRVEQYSLAAGTLQRETRNKQHSLPTGKYCIGLTRLDNAHRIQAVSPETMFLSMRLYMGKRSSQTNVLRIACYKLGLFLSVLGAAHAYACEKTAAPVGKEQATPTDVAAIHRLSLKYLHGDDVPVDRKKAQGLAYQAARQGHAPSRQLYDDLLNGIYDEMTGC